MLWILLSTCMGVSVPSIGMQVAFTRERIVPPIDAAPGCAYPIAPAQRRLR
jgi:hypothetical protein